MREIEPTLGELIDLDKNKDEIVKPKGFLFWRWCPVCGGKIKRYVRQYGTLSTIYDLYYEMCSNPHCSWERAERKEEGKRYIPATELKGETND